MIRQVLEENENLLESSLYSQQDDMHIWEYFKYFQTGRQKGFNWLANKVPRFDAKTKFLCEDTSNRRYKPDSLDELNRYVITWHLQCCKPLVKISNKFILLKVCRGQIFWTFTIIFYFVSIMYLSSFKNLLILLSDQIIFHTNFKWI